MTTDRGDGVCDGERWSSTASESSDRRTSAPADPAPTCTPTTGNQTC